MLNYPKVAIIYLSYHCEPFLERAIEAFKKLNYPRDRWSIIVVDNLHPNYGSSASFIKNNLLVLSENLLPKIIFLSQEKNTGFAEGHNIGTRWALENNFDYVFFHNQDGYMAPNALSELVGVMEDDKQIGVAQSLILLYPEINLINTSGNKLHYLGFGYCGDYRKKVSDYNLKNKEISYASGAAMMLRADLLKQYGLLDEDFFSYHEDLEYSLRLRMLNYKIVLAPVSIFYHEYEFNRNSTKFYYAERNRFGLWFMYFKWPTLLLLLPIELVVEFGLLLFALKNGWIKQWAKVYWYWLQPSNWKFWWKKRIKIQTMRLLKKDKDILQFAEGKIEFEAIDGLLLKVGNLFLNLYWQIIKRLIFW